MNRRITKKRAKWHRPPQVRGPLTAENAASPLPRLIQRLKSHNEAWLLMVEGRRDVVACLLPARYYVAMAVGDETQETPTLTTDAQLG